MAEEEQQALLNAFGKNITAKRMQTLKANIKTKLATISPLCPTPDVMFIGQPLFTFTPVSPVEVAKLLS